jgi:hypothetical protein
MMIGPMIGRYQIRPMRDQERLTSVEIQAVSVEDAIRLALDKLQLGREDVDI